MVRKKKHNNHYSWARAFRDIVVTAMNRGQLPVLGVMSIFMLILWRIPEQDLSTILAMIISHLVAGELIAYIFLFIVCSAWFLQSKVARKNHSEEMNRVTEEKSQLQNMLTKKKFKSSEQ